MKGAWLFTWIFYLDMISFINEFVINYPENV